MKKTSSFRSTLVAISMLLGHMDLAAAQSQGQWNPACPELWDFDAANVVHMSDGTILGWDEGIGGPHAFLWDIFGCALTGVPNTKASISCGGQCELRDGSALIVGGGDTFPFDPTQAWMFKSGIWTQRHSMTCGRFYPTVIALGNSTEVVLGGTGLDDCCVLTPSVYNQDTDAWQDLTEAARDLGQYPFAFLLQDGRVAVVGFHQLPQIPSDCPSFEQLPALGHPIILNLSTQQWTVLDTSTFVSQHGSAVMYQPGKVLMCGGYASGSAIANADTIDFNVATIPIWAGNISPMNHPRRDLTLVTLPDGKVLAVGGTDINAEYVKPVEWFDTYHPEVGWTELAAMTDGRGYHSTALLLPDATVLATGESDSSPGGEIFTPPYLTTGNPRPTIAFAPAAANYAGNFTVRVNDALQIAKVSLVRLGAVTHGFDQNQRCVPLNFTVLNSVTLRVYSPANGNVAPPGYYMLFVISNAGVPSRATYFQLIGSGPT